jgi:putative ABC transport system permease protein
MNILESMRMALQSLWANKLRSVLTLLGVVIGVAAVIAVVTFISGINGYVSEKIFNLGADVFFASKTPSVITNVDVLMESRKRQRLTVEDYEAIAEACKSCKMVGAAANVGNGHIKYEMRSSSDSRVRGWTASMAPIYDLDVVAGRSITDADNNSASHVVVIGHDILDNLMPGTDPLGKEIRVDGEVFTVVGVGKKEGKTLGQSRDNWVMMPLNSWQRIYGDRKNSVEIWAKAYGVGSALESAMDEVRVVLRSRRHVAPGRPDNFEVSNNETFLAIWDSLSSTFFVATVALASISLIIGGIVIMNIMLVSVTERTREIGIRKALGARRHDVLMQFLVEAGTMSLTGGIIGIVLGIFVAKTVTLLIGMPSAIKLWAVLAAMVVSSLVGLISGVYPAWRAAALNPIAALRFEL